MTIADATVHPSGLRVTLEPATSPIAERSLIFAVVEAPNQLRLYAGTQVQLAPGQSAVLDAVPVDDVAVLDAARSPILGNQIQSLPIGTVVGLTPDLKAMIALNDVLYQWEDIDVTVVQDESRTRAILIPQSGGAPFALPNDRYRFTLNLARDRYSTTSAADAISRYSASADLLLDL
jgi:hypothetical protein